MQEQLNGQEPSNLILDYARAVLSGVGTGIADTIHTITHPLDDVVYPITDLIYDATIITAAEVEWVSYLFRPPHLSYIASLIKDNPEIYRQAKERMQNRIDNLKKLGDAISNSTGPQRVEMLVATGTTILIPGTFLKATRAASNLYRFGMLKKPPTYSVASMGLIPGQVEEVVTKFKKLSLKDIRNKNYVENIIWVINEEGELIIADTHLTEAYKLKKPYTYYSSCDEEFVKISSLDRVGHRDIGGLKPVYAAGELTECNGRISLINSQSGCYAPQGAQLETVVRRAFINAGFKEVRSKDFIFDLFLDPNYKPKNIIPAPNTNVLPAYLLGGQLDVINKLHLNERSPGPVDISFKNSVENRQTDVIPVESALYFNNLDSSNIPKMIQTVTHTFVPFQSDPPNSVHLDQSEHCPSENKINVAPGKATNVLNMVQTVTTSLTTLQPRDSRMHTSSNCHGQPEQEIVTATNDSEIINLTPIDNGGVSSSQDQEKDAQGSQHAESQGEIILADNNQIDLYLQALTNKKDAKPIFSQPRFVVGGAGAGFAVSIMGSGEIIVTGGPGIYLLNVNVSFGPGFWPALGWSLGVGSVIAGGLLLSQYLYNQRQQNIRRKVTKDLDRTQLEYNIISKDMTDLGKLLAISENNSSSTNLLSREKLTNKAIGRVQDSIHEEQKRKNYAKNHRNPEACNSHLKVLKIYHENLDKLQRIKCELEKDRWKQEFIEKNQGKTAEELNKVAHDLLNSKGDRRYISYLEGLAQLLHDKFNGLINEKKFEELKELIQSFILNYEQPIEIRRKDEHAWDVKAEERINSLWKKGYRARLVTKIGSKTIVNHLNYEQTVAKVKQGITGNETLVFKTDDGKKSVSFKNFSNPFRFKYDPSYPALFKQTLINFHNDINLESDQENIQKNVEQMNEPPENHLNQNILAVTTELLQGNVEQARVLCQQYKEKFPDNDKENNNFSEGLDFIEKNIDKDIRFWITCLKTNRQNNDNGMVGDNLSDNFIITEYVKELAIAQLFKYVSQGNFDEAIALLSEDCLFDPVEAENKKEILGQYGKHGDDLIEYCLLHFKSKNSTELPPGDGMFDSFAAGGKLMQIVIALTVSHKFDQAAELLKAIKATECAENPDGIDLLVAAVETARINVDQSTFWIELFNAQASNDVGNGFLKIISYSMIEQIAIKRENLGYYREAAVIYAEIQKSDKQQLASFKAQGQEISVLIRPTLNYAEQLIYNLPDSIMKKVSQFTLNLFNFIQIFDPELLVIGLQGIIAESSETFSLAINEGSKHLANIVTTLKNPLDIRGLALYSNIITKVIVPCADGMLHKYRRTVALLNQLNDNINKLLIIKNALNTIVGQNGLLPADAPRSLAIISNMIMDTGLWFYEKKIKAIGEMIENPNYLFR